jgi:hypothetical protein
LTSIEVYPTFIKFFGLEEEFYAIAPDIFQRRSRAGCSSDAKRNAIAPVGGRSHCQKEQIKVIAINLQTEQ